jgi:hypothetical protein
MCQLSDRTSAPESPVARRLALTPGRTGLSAAPAGAGRGAGDAPSCTTAKRPFAW